MIINEAPLVRAMKEAWKRSGYKVIGYEMDATPWIGIYTGAWLVEVETENAPRKALGLIAEHTGRLPVCGEAYTVRKDDVQDEVYAMAMAPIEELWRKALDNNTAKIRAKRTDLHWRRLRVWQRADTLDVILANPDYIAITATPKNEAYVVGDTLYVEGSTSRAYIFRVAPQEDEKAMIQHLGRMQWVSMN